MSKASAMTPVQPKERIEIVDVLRGISILGVLLVNMENFAGQYTPLYELEGIDRAATLFIKFFAQAKFYTLFSFLFGWGMSVQMERAVQRGERFVPLYVRRLLVLLLIGSIHATLIWDGDILLTYALLGFPLLLFRKSSNRMLLVMAAICLLIPVLVSIPGPGEAFREAYGEATESYRHAVMAGHRTDVFARGDYLDVTRHRLKSLRYGYSQAAYWAAHILGMFLLGLYAGQRKIFHNISAHLSLFRKMMWGGLIVGVAFNLVFVSEIASPPPSSPSPYHNLATRGSLAIGGPALCLFYISAIVLLFQKKWQREKLTLLAAVGRMALSNYLSHSFLCTLIFYGYGLGFYGEPGPAITLVLTVAIYLAQIGLSNWWLRRYRFGPAEWLWRSFTYGKLQHIRYTL